MLPLDGITVLSLAEQLPGPYATLVLRDLGADVVMVERPAGGDPVRRLPGMFAAMARGKRSVALDLKRPAGRAAFLRLAASADAVIEGFRPGTVDRLGVGDEAVRAVNEAVVYVSLSGFGQDGPYRDRPAHDVVYQALGGLLHDRRASGEPGPVPALPVADIAAGTFAALAIVTGLVGRLRTGSGGYVDLAMTDALVSWMAPLLGAQGHAVPPPSPGYGVYRTADGALIALGVTHEDHLWRDLCQACGLDDLAPVGTLERRSRHAELDARVREVMRTRTVAEWDRVLGVAGVAYGPVLDVEALAADPQVAARGLLVDGDAARPWSARQPLGLGGAAPREAGDVPELGQHTHEVLLGAGYNAAEVEALIADGAALG